MPTLAWLHNLSPFLVQFSSTFGLRWYGLAYATGFLIAWWWLRLMSRRGMTPLSQQRVSDAMLLLVMGVVVGGRLGYVIFYDRELLTTFSRSFPFWGVLQLQHGGMSSHGGMMGVILACWLIARGRRDQQGVRREQVSWLHVIDLTAITCTAGLMLGRIANFINGELLGKVVAKPGDPAPWWAVKFPQELVDGHAPPLTFDQEQALAKLAAPFQTPGATQSETYERMITALQSGGSQARQLAHDLDPLISARYPSQLMQAATDGLILGGLLWLIWAKPRKPGVIGAWFMIIYGILRISTEFVRLPDAQLKDLKDLTGLSMGQWLSVGMVIVGVIGLAVVTRRNVPKMGGWAKRV